jgi:hypothetical protein
LGSLPDAEGILDYIYMDLSGKISQKSIGGGQYYFKITDAFSSYKHVYILSSKSQAVEKFKSYCNEVQNFLRNKIRNVVPDGAGEFCSKEFEKFYSNTGITHHIAAPYTPQLNSIAERGNRTTSENARALLKKACLSPGYWDEAVKTVVFYENITPMCCLKWATLHKLWFKQKFNVTRLHTFGCRAYVNISKERRDSKFGDTAKKGILLGYRQGIHNWRILLPGGRVDFSHHVVFDKNIYPGTSPDLPAGDEAIESFSEEDESSSPSRTAQLHSSPLPTTPNPSMPSVFPMRPDSPLLLWIRPVQWFVAPHGRPPAGELLPLRPRDGPSVSQQSPAAAEPPQRAPKTLTSSSAENVNSHSSNPKPKPGYSYEPVEQPASKAISSNISTSNILPSKRRQAQFATAQLTTSPFYNSIFAMSVSPASANPSTPKTHCKAIGGLETSGQSGA